MLDRSLPTQTVNEGRDPKENRDDGGLHDHWELIGSQLYSGLPHIGDVLFTVDCHGQLLVLNVSAFLYAEVLTV